MSLQAGAAAATQTLASAAAAAASFVPEAAAAASPHMQLADFTTAAAMEQQVMELMDRLSTHAWASSSRPAARDPHAGCRRCCIRCDACPHQTRGWSVLPPTDATCGPMLPLGRCRTLPTAWPAWWSRCARRAKWWCDSSSSSIPCTIIQCSSGSRSRSRWLMRLRVATKRVPGWLVMVWGASGRQAHKKRCDEKVNVLIWKVAPKHATTHAPLLRR